MDDQDRGDTHRDAHQDAAERCTRESMEGRKDGIEQKDRKDTSRDHENREFRAFVDIQRPVKAKRAKQGSL
jgi:hypothetical protein